ncbi:MAG TPA: hypothetical protein PLD25_19030 [Chloroflexota bacterium]|nr:hypothetical protein [Chloroflexota bacterium]HUM70229.1 hypothetical protein [Chloroflexota bacterium]
MSSVTYVGVVREGKVELKDAVGLPEGYPVYVVVPVLLDEKTARRKANRWLLENVGNMVMADQGSLQQHDDMMVWRFGAFITASTHPPTGPIGYVEIDAANGRILSDSQSANMMIADGQTLTSSPS